MILEKLQKLGIAAKYDSCGGSKQKNFREYGIPYQYQNFIHNCTQTSENVFIKKVMSFNKNSKNKKLKLYEKDTPSEREKNTVRKTMEPFLNSAGNKRLNKANKCLLLKVLQDNACTHDCKYCLNNSCKSKEKVMLEPTELANSFLHLHKKGMTTGLFLSSAVRGNAEKSTEKMLESIKQIRNRGYQGYIHTKVLPETPQHLIEEMGLYSNRMSLNIEAGTSQGFQELTSTKKYKQDILKKVRKLDSLKKKCNKKISSDGCWFFDDTKIQNGTDSRFKSFTTQIILGANEETDKDIVKRVDSLYENTDLYRTYFSAFSPVDGTQLEKRVAQNGKREHRLYEVDWLFRIYGFNKKLVLSGLNEKNNFSLGYDVKQGIALAHPELFPIDPNTATREELLIIPNFGPKTVNRILDFREKKTIKTFNDLEEEGIRFRKAKNFIELEGKQTSLINF